jgi:hypothetical protein
LNWGMELDMGNGNLRNGRLGMVFLLASRQACARKIPRSLLLDRTGTKHVEIEFHSLGENGINIGDGLGGKASFCSILDSNEAR